MIRSFFFIRKKVYFLACAVLFNLPATAQQSQADTARYFTLDNLYAFIIKRHPVVKQAALLSDQARARLLATWGDFDPTLKAYFDQKDFGNTNYYTYWQSELKVPLWLAGADLKVGYDRTAGTYINPEKRTANGRLSLVGLSVPLGQGLLIDARRNTLKQARLMLNYADAERINQINEIWFSAVKDYWNWYNTYAQYQFILNGVNLAQRRFEAIKTQADIGDLPPIDSVEASITVYDRRIEYEKLRIDLQNATLILSNYLWDENDQPLQLPANAKPQLINAIAAPGRARLDSLLASARERHPELQMLRSQYAQLLIETRFRREMLRPKLNVSGNLLSNRTWFGQDIAGIYDFNRGNFKLGVDFAFPLFLRAERGRLREVKLQRQELDYTLRQTGRDISNNITTSYNDLKAYESQFALQIQSIKNQQLLLQGELQKFELGESTLFVVNSRETKLIDMQMKQAEIITGYEKKLAELYFTAGTRINNTQQQE